MHLLISEFICGGGWANQSLPMGLELEGRLMLRSLLNDCIKIDNCKIVTTLDPRIQLPVSNIEIITVTEAGNYIQQVQTSAKAVDMTWIIAPEYDDILLSIVNGLKNNRTVNCSIEAIQITGDKLKTAEAMQAAKLPVISHLDYGELTTYSDAVVVKPRFGVGAEGLRICNNGEQAKKYVDDRKQWVVQPYIKGEHRSLSLLCWQGQARILSCNIQRFDNFPQPRLSKCIVNAYPATKQLISLAAQIAEVFPGLRGYVGVDYIETDHGCVLVEINPRLTTSYIGLANALVQNPAKLCIDTFVGASLPNNIENTRCSTEVALV